MSVSMYWYKPPTERKALGSSGYPLKGIFAKRYGQYDGSMHEEFTLGERDLEFIEGLVAADIDGAQQLLDDLQKYGTLEVIYS